MAKITLHGMFARVKGKFNKSETLYFKGCPCGKEQLGVDLLNPSKANGAKNVQSQNALKTAVQAAKTALADPTERFRKINLNKHCLIVYIPAGFAC